MMMMMMMMMMTNYASVRLPLCIFVYKHDNFVKTKSSGCDFDDIWVDSLCLRDVERFQRDMDCGWELYDPDNRMTASRFPLLCHWWRCALY